MASYSFYLLIIAFYLKYVHCTRYNTMYRLCFLSDASFGGTRCTAVRWMRAHFTPGAHYPSALRKIVTADNNIATFSASKPYLFLTWKALRRVHKYLKKKTNILWHFFGEGKWIIFLRTACICHMSDIYCAYLCMKQNAEIIAHFWWFKSNISLIRNRNNSF